MWLRGSHKIAVKFLARAIVSKDLTGDRDVFIATWLLTENLPHGPLHRTAYYMCLLRTSDPREKMHPNCKLWSFYNLFLTMTYHHFYHILFIRSKSLCPAHTQREKYPKNALDHQRVFIPCDHKYFAFPPRANYTHPLPRPSKGSSY